MNAEDTSLHAELEARLRFETLISDLSSRFVNLPDAEVDREIMDAQRRICDLLGIDLSALWQWSDEAPGFFRLTHFYSAHGGSLAPGRKDREDFPWIGQEMRAGRILAISSLEELPAEAARDREVARQLGIKSNLSLPLSVGGKPAIGVLGLSTTRAERDWPEALVKRLQLVAHIFTNALVRKRSDQALRESEERLSLAAESAEAGLWVLDCATHIFWTTEKARSNFGYSPDEVISIERLKTSVHPDDWALVQGSLDRSLHTGEPVNVEYRIRLDDGGERWIASRGRPFFKSTGEPERLLGLSMDITERKRIEETFRASEARLAAGTDLAGLGYYEVDYGEPYCFMDDRFRHICGVPPELQQGLEPVGFWLEHVHPDDRQFLLDERQKLHDGRIDRISAEYRYLHPTQGQKWIHHLARIAAPSTTGRGARTFGVLRDITPQKQAEMEAQELRGNLAHAGRVTLLGQLASALAHELSQPLGAILRNAEAAEILLQESSPDLEELRAIVADILSDNQRAGQVINRLRSLLKRRSLDPQPIELPGVIAEVISLVHADAAARHVKLACSAAPGLPMVRGDRIHLQQVLLNLIVNAMDALDGCAPDQRCIQVSAHRTDPATVEVRVSDNGPGIPDEALARLFEPFFTTKSKGMGLGLSVSQTIIEAHKGRLWAENGPEGGACFCFTVPVADGGSIRRSDE